MRRMNKVLRTHCLVVLAASFLIYGCAQEPYVKPRPIAPPKRVAAIGTNSEIVQGEAASYLVLSKTKDAVWKNMVESLRRSNFAIETLDQKTGRAVLRYNGDPKAYIDCGRVVQTVKTEKGEKKYDFPAAQAYMQYEIMRQGKVYQVDRKMNLDARITVSFAELDSGGTTKVSAQSGYAVTRDQSAFAQDEKPLSITDTINLKSGESATFPNAPTRCQATGKLEYELLSGLR
jgi:hypothetical protein